MALTPKQQAFVTEYLVDFNATRAAERAGYRGSVNTLAVTGHDLLRNPKVDEAISQRLEETVMRKDEVLMRLADLARADVGRWLSDDGEIDIALMKADGATPFIKKIKRTVRSGTNKDGGEWSVVASEVELHDSLAAKQLIARHHGLLTDKVEHSGDVGIIDATDPRERLASRIAGLAARAGTNSNPERSDDRGSSGA